MSKVKLMKFGYNSQTEQLYVMSEEKEFHTLFANSDMSKSDLQDIKDAISSIKDLQTEGLNEVLTKNGVICLRKAIEATLSSLYKARKNRLKTERIDKINLIDRII